MGIKLPDIRKKETLGVVDSATINAYLQAHGWTHGGRFSRTYPNGAVREWDNWSKTTMETLEDHPDDQSYEERHDVSVFDMQGPDRPSDYASQVAFNLSTIAEAEGSFPLQVYIDMTGWTPKETE